MTIILLLGRILYSIVFIVSSFGHFTSGTVQYAASAGVPLPNILVPLSGIIALIGGLCILTGFKARYGAWLIVIFLVPLTLMIHNFWSVTDPQAAEMAKIEFFKNLSMLGGALIIAYFGSGPLSIDQNSES